MHERRKSKLAVPLCANPCCPKSHLTDCMYTPNLDPKFLLEQRKLNDARCAYENDNSSKVWYHKVTQTGRQRDQEWPRPPKRVSETGFYIAQGNNLTLYGFTWIVLPLENSAGKSHPLLDLQLSSLSRCSIFASRVSPLFETLSVSPTLCQPARTTAPKR